MVFYFELLINNSTGNQRRPAAWRYDASLSLREVFIFLDNNNNVNNNILLIYNIYLFSILLIIIVNRYFQRKDFSQVEPGTAGPCHQSSLQVAIILMGI